MQDATIPASVWPPRLESLDLNGTRKIFAWIGAVSGCIAILGCVYTGWNLLFDDSVFGESHFIGKYKGIAEGYEFTLGLESVGGGLIVGEINFGSWNYVEVQLNGNYDKNNDLLNLQYRRNEGHPSGHDEGAARITYDQEQKEFKGFWSSSIIPGNEQKWILKKTSSSYKVLSWDG